MYLVLAGIALAITIIIRYGINVSERYYQTEERGFVRDRFIEGNDKDEKVW